MKSFNVGHRLALLVGLFVVLLVAIGLLGLNSAAKTLAGLKTVYEDRAVPLVQISRVKHLLDANYAELLRAFQHNPASELSKLHDHPVDEHLKRIETNLKDIDETWKQYMATYLTPDEKQLADAFSSKYSTFTTELTLPTMEALRQGDYSLAVVSRFLKGNRDLGGELDKLAQSLLDLQSREAKAEFNKALDQYESARVVSIASIVLGVLLGIGLSWWLIHSVTSPLEKIRNAVAHASSSGDFTQNIAVDQRDEVGETARAFNELLVSLRTTLGDLLRAIGQVNSAAGDLSDNAQQSAIASSATSESASAMAASVEQMSVSISEVGNGTRQALELARQAGEFSSQGGEVIQKAVAEIAQIANTVRRVSDTIAELGSRSERISSVVQVIKEVADQTNLLALNAAIEAARAGEAGRGFAVVADEVRKLAERTTGATGEIGQMVDEIQGSARNAVAEMGMAVNQVDAGVELAEQAGRSITDIRNSTAEVARVVSDITDAIVEQGVASQSIAAQVERVAQAAEENNAAAGQSSDAANQMRHLAEQMSSLAGRFRI
ncbi:MAG: methyl-accepting chemotaxis protein [Betaproteobacteria bacterium]|nr:methyl-accepting chemotaxis protein [Betaproteobacteria bacterium]